MTFPLQRQAGGRLILQPVRRAEGTIIQERREGDVYALRMSVSKWWMKDPITEINAMGKQHGEREKKRDVHTRQRAQIFTAKQNNYQWLFDSFLCSVESVIDFAHSLLCTHAGRIVKLGIPSRCCTILCVASTAFITYAPPHLLFTWVSVTYKHSHLRRHFGVHTLMQI